MNNLGVHMKSLQTEKTSCINLAKKRRQEGRGVPGGKFAQEEEKLKTDLRAFFLLIFLPHKYQMKVAMCLSICLSYILSLIRWKD